MNLYRISQGHAEASAFKLVHPAVPANAFQSEDSTIPRVCLAKSLDGCLTALSPSAVGINLLWSAVKKHPRGTPISKILSEIFESVEIPYTVLEFEVGEREPDFWPTSKVAQYVPDAFYTGECWLLKPAEPVDIRHMWLVSGDIVTSRIAIGGKKWRYMEVKNSVWSSSAQYASRDFVQQLLVLAQEQLKNEWKEQHQS